MKSPVDETILENPCASNPRDSQVSNIFYFLFTLKIVEFKFRLRIKYNVSLNNDIDLLEA